LANRPPGTGDSSLRARIRPSVAREPYRQAIELGLSPGRNALAIRQDLVSDYGLPSGCQTVKRCICLTGAHRLEHRLFPHFDFKVLDRPDVPTPADPELPFGRLQVGAVPYI
jgi:hypothetical protein